MTARHLLSFIKRKAVEDADRKVFIDRQKKELTLCEVFKLAGLSSSNFTLNMLDCHVSLLILFLNCHLFQKKSFVFLSYCINYKLGRHSISKI